MSRGYGPDFDKDIQIMLGQINEILSAKGDILEWEVSRRNEYYVIEQGYETIKVTEFLLHSFEIWVALLVAIEALEQLLEANHEQHGC